MRIILPDRRVFDLDDSPRRIEEIILQLGIKPGSVVAIRNGRVVPETTTVADDDEVRLLKIAHGG